MKILEIFVFLLLFCFHRIYCENSVDFGGIFNFENDQSDSSSKLKVEEDEDGMQECPVGLSGFVRSVNISSYLPDDFDELTEEMLYRDLYAPVSDMNHTIQMVERLVSYREKLKTNKDLNDAINYVVIASSKNILSSQVSFSCSADILRVLLAIKNQEFWALKSEFFL